MSDSNLGKAARAAALDLLFGVLIRKQPLSELLINGSILEKLYPADRARAQRLAVTTLRCLGKADAVLASHIDRMPPASAHNILRLAVVELLENGEAPHGVVDSAVTLMRRNPKARQFAGLGNAVLRKVSANDQGWSDLAAPELPKWLRRRIVHIYDEGIVRDIETAHMAGAPLDITLKPGQDTQEWAEKLDAQPLPGGSLRIARSVQISELPGYEEGAWWVQDAAAGFAARLIGPIEGARVLDICAAPGGKTMQLAVHGAQVTALDISGPRMGRVEENLKRTGLVATCVTADALHWQAEPFDAVLLDAPCSATGTIRRHPDLPFVKTGKELHALFELQEQLLDRAVALTKPGGRIVYCTCSLLTEEGERHAKLAIERHGLSVAETEISGLDPAWAREGGGYRLRPDYWSAQGGMDGFFMIALQKPH